MSSDEKKHCVGKLIGTHSGCFHCDECLACAMLLMLDQFKDHTILRTRDTEQLAKCDIVVDVGTTYDHDAKRYDHHQKTFNESMNSLDDSYESKIMLSSAGLIYYHYGKQIIESLTGASGDTLQMLFNKIHGSFIEGVDAVDNGISANDHLPRYKVPNSLPERVSFLNPAWNEELSDEQIQQRFMKAVEMTSIEFKERVHFYFSVWLPARSLVMDGLQSRFDVHPSGQVMMMPTSCPWKQHFFDIEELNGKQLDVYFVIYQDTNVGDYRIQAVPINSNSFKLRIPLAKEWNGLRNEELCEIVGIDDCIFVHANGFIGGAKSLETAVLMASKSVEMFQPSA